MELQGKVIVALTERTGVSSRGEWKSQDFVIETHVTAVAIATLRDSAVSLPTG